MTDIGQQKVIINKDTTDLKIVIIGNSGTGKTSFSSRWTKDIFTDSYKATVMSDFSFKIFEYKSKYYKIQLWDIAGQDRNIQLSKVFAKNAHGCIIMTDITNPASKESSCKWKQEIDINTPFIDGGKMPCLLIQNKIDLVENEDNLDQEEIKKFVKENGYINYFNTSAKTGLRVNEAMDYLIHNIVDRLEEYIQKTGADISNERKSIVIQTAKAKNISLFDKKGCSC